MIFVVGPRQVGKTTLCTRLFPKHYYFNWDNQDHRALIIGGPTRVGEEIGVHQLQEKPEIVVFDEIHKYSKWKQFLKGLFDVYDSRIKIIVTGSSRLDVFKKGGDSLMGRYFQYHLHPVSIRETIAPEIGEKEIQPPHPIDPVDFETLFTFGGFPEPYLKADLRFSNRWKKLRRQQFFNEDIRDFTRVQEVHQIDLLAEILKHQSGQLINYSNLAKKVNVSVDTIRRWIKVLESLYYCFTIQPWSRNVSRSLLKQPKIYLWDWSLLADSGAKSENFVASHLLKAVHWWTDNGFGDYGLFFLRNKDGREVDFLVVRNQEPWFLTEVKTGQSKSISKDLFFYQKQIQTQHAFQANFAMDYVGADCFSTETPTIVPVKTLLSQLV
ncbi:MAG: ATP-binding protein [Deltaproteobacteria bacterium]|nr:ATP-binding protein [Deltaproteobacteria bacterium]